MRIINRHLYDNLNLDICKKGKYTLIYLLNICL